jgi:hypothetical protein
MARTGFYVAGFNRSPADYFPFPIPHSATVPDPRAFYYLNFQDAFNFVWRYRQLKMEFDVTMEDGLGNTDETSGSIITANIPNGIFDEQHIGQQPYIRQYAATDDSSGHAASCDLMLNTYLPPPDDKFQMFLELIVFTSLGTLTSDPVVGGNLIGNASVLDHEIPMYCSIDCSFSIEVSIDQWYEYRTGAGTTGSFPIWDKDDGHQLISPVPRGFSP